MVRIVTYQSQIAFQNGIAYVNLFLILFSNFSILDEILETMEKINQVFDKSATLNFIINRLVFIVAMSCFIIGSLISLLAESIIIPSIVFMIFVILIGLYLCYVCCAIKIILWKCTKILETTNRKSKLKITRNVSIFIK